MSSAASARRCLRRRLRAESAATAAPRLLMLTGCRGAFIGPRWADAWLDRSGILPGKSRTCQRTKSSPPPAVRVLVHLPRPAGTPWVIAGAKPGERLPQFNQHRYRVRKRARLEEVRLDDLRHGLASLAPTLGEPPPVIARLLGHGKIQTTARDAHLARDSVRDAADWAAASILPSEAPKPRQ